MPNYVFAYHGGKMPDTPEEGQRLMAAWNAWYEKMGSAVVDGGAPVGKSVTVTATGIENNGGANPISGYTIVSAADMDAAPAGSIPRTEVAVVFSARYVVIPLMQPPPPTGTTTRSGSPSS